MNTTRRQMLQRSAAVAGLLAGLGLLPQAAQAAWNAAAFRRQDHGRRW
jgi:sulfur-oxidizing protein SoxY